MEDWRLRSARTPRPLLQELATLNKIEMPSSSERSDRTFGHQGRGRLACRARCIRSWRHYQIENAEAVWSVATKIKTGRPAAHALARYRCFLPDLAGLAGLRRAGPGPFILTSGLTVTLGHQRPVSAFILAAIQGE